MNERLTSILDGLRERFPEGLGDPEEYRGEVSIDVPRERIRDVMRWFRDEGGFDQLMDWSAVDYLNPPSADDRLVPGAPERFLCAAILASVVHAERLRVRVWVPEDDPRCASLVPVWPGTDFLEREMFDFFGITFEGHPNLRRIFMPDEWDGHPQRKDYPLGGVNTQYHHGNFIPPPDVRKQPTTTTGYPGRIA